MWVCCEVGMSNHLAHQAARLFMRVSVAGSLSPMSLFLVSIISISGSSAFLLSPSSPPSASQLYFSIFDHGMSWPAWRNAPPWKNPLLSPCSSVPICRSLMEPTFVNTYRRPCTRIRQRSIMELVIFSKVLHECNVAHMFIASTPISWSFPARNALKSLENSVCGRLKPLLPFCSSDMLRQ